MDPATAAAGSTYTV